MSGKRSPGRGKFGTSCRSWVLDVRENRNISQIWSSHVSTWSLRKTLSCISLQCSMSIWIMSF
jgi:hypothetical protein